MDGHIRYRGKTYTSTEIDEIREVIAVHRDKSRWFISRELCRKWNWTQPNGVLKDMICRGLLLRLNAQGLIELPPPTKNPLIFYRSIENLPFFKSIKLLSSARFLI